MLCICVTTGTSCLRTPLSLIPEYMLEVSGVRQDGPRVQDFAWIHPLPFFRVGRKEMSVNTVAFELYFDDYCLPPALQYTSMEDPSFARSADLPCRRDETGTRDLRIRYQTQLLWSPGPLLGRLRRNDDQGDVCGGAGQGPYVPGSRIEPAPLHFYVPSRWGTTARHPWPQNKRENLEFNYLIRFISSFLVYYFFWNPR